MVAVTTNSRWAAPLRSILGRSILAGFAIFLLGCLSDVWHQHYGGGLLLASIDDAVIGVGAGVMVFFYERRQHQNLARKLEVIRLMNHHVRNSLQVISLAASIPQREELTCKIQEAVERIEWALREVLPGQREDINDLVFGPQMNVSPTEKPKTAT